MYLTVTIDTEEDNWGEYDRASYSVENIGRVCGLQQIFAARGIRPTYLITYPVATSRLGIEVLGKYQADGLCEIGTHLHPWNTPPIEEERTPVNSFVNHLSPALQFRKLTTLHETITRNFGVAPTSFRSGRWGFSDDVARHLIRLSYRTDSSISPAIDWGEYGGPDYSRCSLEPFTYSVEGTMDGSGGLLLEVPATVWFPQARSRLASSAYRSIRSRVPFGRKILAALDRLGALNRISLSPELDGAARMIRLTRALLNRGTPVVNVFFHSPSLLEGCSPYARTAGESRELLERIDSLLAFASTAGLRSRTLSELTGAMVGASRVQNLQPSTALGRAATES